MNDLLYSDADTETGLSVFDVEVVYGNLPSGNRHYLVMAQSESHALTIFQIHVLPEPGFKKINVSRNNKYESLLVTEWQNVPTPVIATGMPSQKVA